MVRRGDICHRREIGDAHCRIRRRLYINHPGGWLDRAFNLFGRGRIHEAEFQPPLHQELSGEPNDAAVDRFRNDGMVARAQEAENGIDGRHAGGKDICAVAAFELCHGALESLAVRMVGSCVVIALVLPKLLLNVRRGLIDRGDDGSCCRIGFLPHMNGVGCKSHWNISLFPQILNGALKVAQDGSRVNFSGWRHFLDERFTCAISRKREEWGSHRTWMRLAGLS